MTLPTRITTAIAAIALAGAPAAAQSPEAPRSTVRGPSLGIHTTVTALTLSESRGTTTGGGLGLSVGYGFGDRFGVHAVASGALLAPSGADSYVLSHVDLEGRWSFGSRGGAWAPSLAVGVSGRTAEFEVPAAQGGGTTARTAIGLTAGGGLRYHLTPATALSGALRYTFGNFKESGCPASDDAVRSCATSTRVRVGVTWYPGAR